MKSVPRDRDESGAVLVLALLFMVTCGLLITGLLAWSGNNLNSVAAFQQSRAVNYAAVSAMTTAIQNVRYSPSACPSGGLTISVPNTDSAFNEPMQIWCSTQTQETAASRTVTFSECTSAAVAALTCSQANPYLQVVVIYDDYVAGDIATGSSCTGHCGEFVTVQSWQYKNIST